METRTVRGSVRLAVQTFGDASGPPLILISGAGSPAEFWPDGFCRGLADSGMFAVRFSHRDTGFSDHFDDPYGIDDLLLDLVDLVRSFGRARVHLVGHSMGGYLAQLAACGFPEEIASVTSISAGSAVTPEICAALGMSLPSDETWEILMRNQPTGDFAADLPGWLATWRFLNGTRPFDEERAICYTRALYASDPRNARVATNHVHAMSTVPDSLAEDLRHMRQGLLVIHGTGDPLVPLDNGEATTRLAPNSRMIRLAGAGHMFFNRDTWDEIRRQLISHVMESN